MNIFSRLAAAATIATAAGLSGLAYAQMDHGSHGAQADTSESMDMEAMIETMMPADGDAASTLAYKKADMDMMHGMAVEYTGNADIDFRTKMIPHHQGAIDMARVALEHATDPETKALAETIIAAQEQEIAEMRAWLEENGQ